MIFNVISSILFGTGVSEDVLSASRY